MNRRLTKMLGVVSSCFALPIMADQSIYCPQNHGYIHTGMSTQQVIAACGQPLAKQQLNQPLTQKIPVLQLIYNNQGTQNAFYGVWSVQTGVTGGSQLEVDVMNNKVYSVRLNGSGTNAFTICGTSIQVGDPVGRVYGACGNPSLVNRTFINQPIQSNQKPEVWTYQADPYQPPFRLTILNGKLQSIN